MFAELAALPPDSLLGLTALFNADPRSQKIDLGVGVYRTADNKTPVMAAVADAERRLGETEVTKAYLPAEGAPGFGEAIRTLIFGGAIDPARVAVVQTPGGCGALRLGAELALRASARGVACGTPTWANHAPLIVSSGLPLTPIRYYDAARQRVDFEAFYDAAARLGPKDALLLHACCHNPTGADLSRDEIDAVIDLAARNAFLPFVDFAYHGFAEGLDADAHMPRRMAERLPEFLIAYSCSKHFGLYRERTGALLMIGADGARAAAMKSHAVSIARQIYSMPPAHGGLLVRDILASPDLARRWRDELETMRRAVIDSRRLLAAHARGHQLGERLDYIAGQNGMFSLLPLTADAVLALRERHGVYVAPDGRANLCGVNAGNVDALCAALADVMRAGDRR
jgi:aspartate/tyrosine/aromatic aminotransferase